MVLGLPWHVWIVYIQIYAQASVELGPSHAKPFPSDGFMGNLASLRHMARGTSHHPAWLAAMHTSDSALYDSISPLHLTDLNASRSVRWRLEANLGLLD
jgi:hypothetical protein